MKQAKEFLAALFGDKPDRAAVQIWVRSSRAVTWCLDDIGAAAHVAVENATKHEVYVGCGLAPKAQARPLRTRLKAHEVVGIPGVWADIDVNGGPDAKDGAAPSVDAALELASALLEPTLLVHSGYGVQAWWCWEDGPWMFPARADSEQAKRIVSGFQGALRAAARRLGWGLDATQDLARVMRIPDTLNHKGSEPAPVKLIEHGGSRYNIEEVGELGQGFLVAEAESKDGLETGEAVIVNVDQNALADPRVVELRDAEPEFDALWNMKKGTGSKRRDWSASEFEFAICNWLVRAGLTPQEICNTLVYWRLRVAKSGSGRIRRDRLVLTIAKVMRSVEVEDLANVTESVRDSAVELLDNVSAGVEKPTEAKVLAAFNRIIGGPEIARLKQFSRDPQRARVAIELADGTEVGLGPVETIITQSQFRKAYAISTGHYPPAVGAKKWDTAIAGLFKVAVVLDDSEDSRVGQLQDVLAEYVEATGSDDRDGACETSGPFTHDEQMHIHIGHLTRWIRRVVGDRVETSDLALLLRLLGFERKTINYRRSDESKSTRSYFVGPTPPSPLRGEMET